MSRHVTNDAEAALDSLEADDRPLYEQVMDAVDLVIDHQVLARLQAEALRTRDGSAVYATVVRGRYPPFHVIWTVTPEDSPLILGYGRLHAD
jgi:hypothetical protein